MKVSPNSPEWLMLSEWNRERISAWTAELQSLDCPAERGHQLRGMIYALQEQAEHVTPRVTPEIEEPNYG